MSFSNYTELVFLGTRYTAPASPPQPPNDSDDEELQAAIRASLHETHHPPPPRPQHNHPYPSHNGENDPAFQAALAESFRKQQQRGSSSINQRDFNPTGPYNESFEPPPSYSEATNERLYPSIPNGASATPSAPPPYDTPVTPPYPEHDTMPTPDVIRQRRLRRFQN